MPTFKREDQEQIERAADLLEAAPRAGSAQGARPMGFVKSLFYGQLRLDRLMPYPKPDEAETARVQEMIGRLEPFLREHVNPDQIDAEERIPMSVIEGLGALGVMGMTTPVEYGGGGFSHTAYCRVLEHVSAWCASTAVLIGAHQSIGLKALILMGTEAQKKQYLPKLASGEMLAAFCLSEPEVGSDAANVQTTARLSDDGSHWILNGHKRYATNAALAGMMTVMAKTPVEIKGKMQEKVTAFIITPDLPGFEIVSHNRSKCGVRGSWQATLRFNDMRVPADRVLGEVGKGLKVALGVLDYGRCTLSAGCVGGAKRALAMACDHARTRKQFGRRIGEFELVQQKIARMAEMTFAMEAVAYMSAALVDRHEGDVMLETAISKLFCSEGLWQIADDLMQIWGGEGYMREHGIERMLRDARINRIVEGTSEVMTAFIALVGMKDVGEELEQIVRAARHPMDNFGRLARFARHQWQDIVVGPDCHGLHDELATEAHTLSRQSRQFARQVINVLRVHREKVLDLELVHERLAGTAMDLFATACVLSRLDGMLRNGATDEQMRRDLTVGRGFCHAAAERNTHRLAGLFDNRDDDVRAVARAALGWEAAGVEKKTGNGGS